MSARKLQSPIVPEANEYAALRHWLHHDNWTTHEGLLLLIGLDPDGTDVARIAEQRTFIRQAKTLTGHVLVHLKTVTAQHELAAVTAKYFELTGRSIVSRESEEAPQSRQRLAGMAIPPIPPQFRQSR